MPFYKQVKYIIFVLIVVFAQVIVSLASPLYIDDIINSLQKRYIRSKTLTASFVQIYRNVAGHTIRESGTLSIKKIGRIRWDYTEPQPKIFLSDGEKTYFYIPAEKRVIVRPISKSEDPRLPFMFLLGSINLRKEFQQFKLNVEPPLKTGNVVLSMKPTKNIGNLSEIRLEYDTAKFNLDRLSLLHISGDRSDFLLSNIKENINLPDSLFIFKLPLGVKVSI